MFKLEIYLEDGNVYEYNVESASKARQHSYAIVQTGYRHTPESKEYMEHYPAHKIIKVKVTPAPSTKYTDNTMGT